MSGFTNISNSSVRRENFGITNSNRLTFPLKFINQTPIQEKGSVIYNKNDDALYYSDGTSWIQVISGTNNFCIDDVDNSTSVCADTVPPTGSETIFFTTNNTLRSIFDSNGVLIATAGAVDPTTIVPAAGKVAHFEGDIDVTGVVDPTGVQYTEQGAPPTANAADEGLLYVSSASVGPYSNTPTYVDGSNTSHNVGNIVGPAGPVLDNSIVRFDTGGDLIQDSPLLLSDTGVISNPTGDIGLDANGGTGTVNIIGNLSVTGEIEDVDGLQFDEQGVPPLVNAPTNGLIYVNSGSTGPYSNTPTFVDGTNTSHPIGNLVGPAGAVSDNAIPRFDGVTGELIQSSPLLLSDTGSISNPTGNIELNPNSGAGAVNISGDLNVMGTTTSIDTQNLLVQDNAIYLNNGYTSTMPLSGCVAVNYVATPGATAGVAGAFTAGIPAGANPTVLTNGAFGWVAGDIIQISGANNVSNNGLFEVHSYAANTITIRGVGTISTTFSFFQNQFVADAVVAGTITKVSVANICSGTDGKWEVAIGANHDTTVGMSFVDISLGGCKVTVGSSLIAQYPTISAAFLAGERSICVITDVTEAAGIALGAGEHLCVQLLPGVTVTGPAATWFTGDNSLVKIIGAGFSSDSTTASLSSRLLLLAGQDLRIGVNVELDMEGVRVQGNGTNILIGGAGGSLGGSCKFSNCRFDTAARFDINLDGHNLNMNNCLSTSPLQLDPTVTSNCQLSDNNLGVVSVIGPIEGGNFIGNILSGNLTFNGTVNSSNVSSSVSSADIIFLGDCDRLIFEGNNSNTFTFGAMGAVIALDDSNISNNVVGADVEVWANIERSNFAANIADGPVNFDIRYEGNFRQSKCSGWYGDDMIFNGNVDKSSVMNNNVQRIIMNLDSDDSNFSFNKLTADLLFNGNGGGQNVVRRCTINNNVISAGAGISFEDGLENCNVVGNNLESGDISVNFAGPNVGSFSSSGVTLSNNTLERVRINHPLSDSSISGNVSTSGDWLINNTCDNCSITANKFTGDLTFDNVVTRVTINSNETSGDVIFDDDCTKLIFNSNICDTFSFGTMGSPISLTDSVVSDNILTQSTNIYANVDRSNFLGNLSDGTSTLDVFIEGIFSNSEFSNWFADDIVFDGNVDKSAVMNNSCQRINFNGNFTDSTCNFNKLTANLLFSGNGGGLNLVRSSNILGNILSAGAGIELEDGLTRCNVNSNNCEPGGEIRINTAGPNANTIASTENTFTGNKADAIRFGTAGGPGIVDNSITGNQVMGSGVITTASAGGNVVVGNRGTPGGFGGGDLVASNL